MLAVIGYVLFLRDSSIVTNMLERMSRLSLKDSSFEQRINSYLFVLERYLDSGAFGIIFGQGSGAINELAGINNTLGSGHNFVISSLYEFGLIGLILVIFLYWKIIFQLWKYRQDLFCRALLCGIVGYMITALTNDSYILGADFFHILYIIVCLSYLTNKRELTLIRE